MTLHKTIVKIVKPIYRNLLSLCRSIVQNKNFVEMEIYNPFSKKLTEKQVKTGRKILNIGGGILAVILFVIGVFLFYINYTDYAPLAKEKLVANKSLTISSIDQVELSFLTWNIGYCGLGSTMDFFYDGGKNIRASEKETQFWTEKILYELFKRNFIDFILLQEVDHEAKRTYYHNQVSEIASTLPNYECIYAINYKIPFVPIPLSKPMGKVISGQLTLSRFESTEANRFSYPQIIGWPKRMFMLDRCFIESRYRTENGAELVVFNTHNSAFVSDQKKMEFELSIIKKQMIKEYEMGNYVIAGGDWNMNPPKFQPDLNYSNFLFKKTEVSIPNNFFPQEWQFVYSSDMPTNRNVDQLFNKMTTPTTTIDYFIVSPNIEVLEIETINLDFEASDHNPVYTRLLLK